MYAHLVKSDWSTATILDIAKKVAMGPFGSNIKVSTFVSEGVPIISGNHLRGYFLEEPEFLLMFFHSAAGQHELLSYANQTGVPSIAQPASNLKKIAFKCPPIEKQLEWQEQVYPLLGRYLNNRLESEKLSTLRDALLPKLMSGELDVSNIDL